MHYLHTQNSQMKDSVLKSQFVKSMIEQDVFLFGDFTLKSGKKTPYFFNLGNVSSGDGLKELGEGFAAQVEEANLQPDVLFGPAYKGIPFVVTTAVAMTENGKNVGVSFNRKEAKAYGEGGSLIGSSIEDQRVVMLDDVVVDGATKIESAAMIKEAGGLLDGIVVGIDRMEYLRGQTTATEALAEQLGVGVYSIVTMIDVLKYLENDETQVENYRIMRTYAESNCKL